MSMSMFVGNSLWTFKIKRKCNKKLTNHHYLPDPILVDSLHRDLCRIVQRLI